MTSHNVYTLSNVTATRLTPNGIHSGMDITLQNINDSGYIYVGAENVSSSSFGFRIAPNAALSFELPGSNDLYAISENNEMLLAKLEIGLEVGN